MNSTSVGGCSEWIDLMTVAPRLTIKLVPSPNVVSNFITYRSWVTTEFHVCNTDTLTPIAFAIHAMTLWTECLVFLSH